MTRRTHDRMRAPLAAARLALAFTLTLACACGSSSGGGGADGGPGTADGGDPSGPDASPACTGGSLCGTPATCCAAGNECVDDMCLPACASGVRCGDDHTICCGAGDVCLAGECVVPGDACADSYDCGEGQFCEPTLGQCLPQPDPLTCEYTPQFTELTVTEEWKHTEHQIISIPVVANLDGVGAPEVAVNLTQQDNPSGDGFLSGRIAVLDGATGQMVIPPIPHAPPTSYGSQGRSTIAVGDVSGDGLPDIVYAGRGPEPGYDSLIVAVDGTGALLWTSHAPDGAPYTIKVRNGGATLANFDDDPEAEVVFGATLIDNDGTVLWEAGTGGSGGFYGSNDGYQGGISAVADLDGDGAPEIISGRDAFKVSWPAGGTPTVTSFWTYAGADGYPAVADLDLDGDPEVVLVANAQVIVLDGQTGMLWCGIDPTGAACATAPRTAPIDIPGGSSQNRGGPPTIADFDGDGRPEIGVAGGHSYSVYDLNRAGEEVVTSGPQPAPGAIFVRWSQATHDLSSNASGSSVFDFQGDGAAEVVYADECYVRVYGGADGAVQLEIPSTNATIHEYPLVVDVDGDNNSEIVLVANDSNSATNCPGVTPRRGIYVYGDANDEWVPTRRVWTQHAYHVTNATSAGNVPATEVDNWTQAGLNNYRQNVQGEGIFNAPDLAIDLSLVAGCADEAVLKGRVTNLGALGVPAGIEVVFYQGDDASGTELGSATTSVALLPGQSTTVSLTIPAPSGLTSYFASVDGGQSGGVVAECDEDNNTDGLTEAGCTID